MYRGKKTKRREERKRCYFYISKLFAVVEQDDLEITIMIQGRKKRKRKEIKCYHYKRKKIFLLTWIVLKYAVGEKNN
jgi:hypothetical protein